MALRLLILLCLSVSGLFYFKPDLFSKKQAFSNHNKSQFQSRFQDAIPALTISFLNEGELRFMKVSLKFHFDNKSSLEEFKSFKGNIKEFVGLSISLESSKDSQSSFEFESVSQKIKEDVNQFLSSGKVKNIFFESVEILEG